MTAPRPMEIQDFIDSVPLSGFQIRTIFLCFLIVAIDGIDLGLAAYVAPSVRHEWHLTAAQLSPIFVSGLIGLTLGALLFGPMADRFGRRPVILCSVFVFGVATLLTLSAHDVTDLTVLRLLSGIGLGGAAPNAVTLTAEFSPRKRRLSLVTMMFCGLSLGSAFGGLVASFLIGHAGWRAMLVFGGVTPLVLWPLLYVLLPESIRFVGLRGNARKAQLQKMVARMSSGSTVDASQLFAAEVVTRRSPVRDLLTAAHLKATVLLWITFFAGLLVLYLFSSWLPTIVANAGGSVRAASLLMATWSIGGTCGAVVLGRVMDRAMPQVVLACAYTVAAAVIFSISHLVDLPVVLALAIFLGGFCISGSQVGVNGLATLCYPTTMRATGVAWASGIGRLGSIAGSLLGGLLLGGGWSIGTIFTVVSIPALVAAICVAGLRMPVTHAEASAPAPSNDSGIAAR
ncbi:MULTISPECIES: MFS transporter [Pandoraea]|uniref:4-hydroxybenzoate transporter n=1 Tax=Pandoraea communis TaxID=2508297 RepID=A0A5E4RAQ0_9BURK|nr:MULTISPECIES: MFS transporter [Pandoraea]EON13824.1 4-hydroxybenzoate transporter [Pandoraea sp. SD6-2]MDM8359576.1 MFS transporter [Pandoraea communis]VVD59198.1 4-hydroxybenzoate transporter [Pandoraea communis]